METSNKQFFEENDIRVNRMVCRILLWLTIIFPVLMLLSVLGVFKLSVTEILVAAFFGCICTITPTILSKCNVPPAVLKYCSLGALCILIAIMGSNSNIGIYMTYVLALALSCLYFDTRYTKTIAGIGFLCMVVAVFIRSRNVVLHPGDTPNSWFLGYVMGFTIEYIAMTVVFLSIVKRARKLLESLHDTGV